jgi:HEAT repeat protein
VHSDLNLPETFVESLLRAGFTTSAADETLLVETLEHPVARARVLALRGLARRAVVTDDQWLRALGDEDVTVRREALTQVSQISPTPAIVDTVIAMVGDEDALVVEGAAFALGEILSPAAVSPLIAVARDHDDARCREAAIAALGALGHDAARDIIIAALDDKPPVRRRAIVALSNFEGPDIDDALAKASDDRDWQVRAAVNQLGRDAD